MKRTIIYLLVWGLGIFLTFDNDFFQSIGLDAKQRLSTLSALVVVLFAFIIYDIPRVFREAKALKRSRNSDPDVAALIDGDIDISEYRRRKEGANDEPSSNPAFQRTVSPPLN